MEILNKNVALLCNSEVHSLLKQIKETQSEKLSAKKKQDKKKSDQQQKTDNENQIDQHLPTIVYESLRYLEKTPCETQTPLHVSDFLRKCHEKRDHFKLTKGEKLQILNLSPKSAVELQYIIEESEERFTIEQMDELLEFIEANLNPNDEENLPEENQEADIAD